MLIKGYSLQLVSKGDFYTIILSGVVITGKLDLERAGLGASLPQAIFSSSALVSPKNSPCLLPS